MSNIAIRCEGLGKQYRIGERERYKALRDTLTDALCAPARRLRSIFNGDAANVLSTDDGVDSTFWALKDVSFEVNHGEVVGIIGRNGAGKSTLLKILSRITKPTEGQVKINGRVGSLLEVGTGFHPELTGRENIFLNGAILGMKRAEIERKFDEIVAFAEIEKFIDTPVKRYSSGMYVRLAFAVAAHLEPEILIIDEVLAVGDSAFQKKCLGKMEQISHKGRTVLFVSHDMNAIQLLCDRVIYLDTGAVAGVGAVSEQIDRYVNDFKGQSNIISQQGVQFSETLELRSFECSPNPVVSGAPLSFKVELLSSQITRLDEIAILVYTSLGRRATVLDLRCTEGAYKLSSQVPFQLSCNVKAFPLIEGEYRIGLYLNCGNVKGDFLDLLDLTVTSQVKSGQIVPYPAVHRGLIELDFAISSSLSDMSVLSPYS